MHDVGVSLNAKPLIHFHRTDFSHPSDIVSSQVHQHDVLSQFFFIA